MDLFVKKTITFVLLSLPSALAAYPEDYPEITGPVQIKSASPKPSSVKQINHVFWIRFDLDNSLHTYSVSQDELLNGIQVVSEPQLLIKGDLVLRSAASKSKCFVKLSKDTIQAKNQYGQKIDVTLRGIIGDKPLSSAKVKPNFDEYNVVGFLIEGYIEADSFNNGLAPGKYSFKDDLRISVEFDD